MDNVYAELDDAKAEVEKLKAECQLKIQLFEGLKKVHAQEFLKFQETTKLIEEQARELHLKSEENHELNKILEDLKSSLHEKEMHIEHLSLKGKNIQANCADRFLKLEESNRELEMTLDEVKARNDSLEQNACARSKEILGLKELLLAAEKKCSEAEEKARQATLLKRRDDVILQLEEENISMKDKIKWRNEQFKHLEEAHEKLQVEFQLSKEEWDKERSALFEEMSSLQVSLDSQARNVEGLQSRLEMCNHALAHEESKRKLLEAEISEFKSSFENVYSQCEEKKSEIQQLTTMRNDEIAHLRNSLGKKEMVVRELERKIVQLEQDNKELGDSLKELREAQIKNGGANSLTSKLRNKLRLLEEVHKSCASILKSKESQWGDQLAKMEADIVTHKSTLTNKKQEIRELQMDLENCYYCIEENRLELLIFKSELAQAYFKSFRADPDKAFGIKESDMVVCSTEQLRVKDNSLKSMAQAPQQHSLLEEELKQQKKKLEESSESQLILEEQLLQMEYTLQYQRSAAFEALQVMELEIASKNDEISRLDCEVQEWKSMAQAAQQHSLSEEELKQQIKKLEESSEGQLILEEQLLQMEYTLQYERNAAFEALEVLELEIASKNNEISRLDCEVQDWKSMAQAAQQHSLSEEELKQQKKKLEESSEGQLILEEQLLQMEYTLQYERSAAFEALEVLEHEIASKNDEISRLDCEVHDWKSTAEILKVSYEESQGTSNKMETSLLSHIENEQALKLANENLLCVVKDQERKTKDLLLQISLLERCNAEKMKEAERCKQEKEGLNQMVEEKECYIKDLQKDIAIACLKQESMEIELKDAIHAQLNAEKALMQEKEILLKIKDEKDQTVKHLKELATTSEQDLLEALSFSSSKQVEKWVEGSVVSDALKNAVYLAKIEIEEKNTRIVKSEESFFNVKQEGEQLQASLEAMKFENKKLTDKQQTMKCTIMELKVENGNLLQDIVNLSTKKEDMLAYFEDIFGRIGELYSGDKQLMEMLENVLNTSEDENEIAIGSVVCDKPHESARGTANVLLFSPTIKKTEENFHGRSPLREVNSLHM